MKTLGLAFTLIITLFISSCQVKEKSSDGGLISGHVPTTNKFTLQTPTAKAYDEGEDIIFTVTFPFDIIMDTTGGDPRLRITVGSTTRYANYDVSTNARTMTFKYTVVAGENDTNGVDVNALELNGSTLKFDNNGTITDCAIATVTTKNFPNVKVDTAGPVATAFTLTNLPANYRAYQKLNFAVTFNEPIYVTGTPNFTVQFHHPTTPPPPTASPLTGVVSYVSGSGTNILTFSYDIPTNLLVTAAYNDFPANLNLNGGTLKDANGNDATLSISSFITAIKAYSASVKIWGQYPNFVSIAMPVDATYLAGETLEFVIEFDRTVNVTGIPYLGITIGSTVRQAQYVSGTGTKFLTFRYTAVPGDVDADGITVPTTITQNAGDIRDTASPNTSFFVVPANNKLVIPTTAGIKVNAIQPQAISVARNTDPSNSVFPTVAIDNKWIIGDILNVTIGFNTPIKVTQTSGTPSIGLVIGSTTKQAPYLSGDGQSSLIFRYIIEEGDLDTDGTISLGTISLNGGVLTDAAGTNVLLTLPAGIPTTTVDGVRPTITSVTGPANGTYSNVNLTTMNFIVTWSEAVNYSATGAGAVYFPMNVGGSTANLQYATNNNNTAITHRATTLSTFTDTDGVTTTSPLLGSATIKDAGGNAANVLTFTPPTTTGVLVDTTAPTVLSVTAITADGTYNVGNNLDFSVTFSEAVTTNVSGGYPRIPITIGASTVYLNPTSNTTSTVHTFRYTVIASQIDTDGVVLGNSVTSNGAGYARDAGQNLVTGTFTPPTTTGIRVDTVAPAAPTVSQTITNGTYETGDSLEIRLTYAEPITVDTAGGTPRISLTMDSGTVYLNYASTVGNTLIFNHTLTGTEYDFTGLTTAVASYALNGGTVKDDGGNNAPTTFTSQNFSSVFAVFQNTKLWVGNNFVTKAKTGSPAVSNGGAVTTTACGTSTCRVFNGDDSLTMGGALSNVETVFIVFVTPSTLNPHNIFSSDIALNNNGISFDLDTSSAALNLDGSTYGSNTSHNTNMGTSTVHILQVDFDSAQNFGGGTTLINATFDGQIGEVMAISGSLTNAQKTAIRTYLNGKY